VDLARLSGPGLRAFFNLGDAWGLSCQEQMDLLGGVSKSTLRRWQRGRVPVLNLDRLERISHLLGIHKSLRILLPTSGSSWVRRPNSSPMFGGRPPLQLMMAGGITWLHRVRIYLDGQRMG
jgi:hypothetical protein